MAVVFEPDTSFGRGSPVLLRPQNLGKYFGIDCIEERLTLLRRDAVNRGDSFHNRFDDGCVIGPVVPGTKGSILAIWVGNSRAIASGVMGHIFK